MSLSLVYITRSRTAKGYTKQNKTDLVSNKTKPKPKSKPTNKTKKKYKQEPQ